MYHSVPQTVLSRQYVCLACRISLVNNCHIVKMTTNQVARKQITPDYRNVFTTIARAPNDQCIFSPLCTIPIDTEDWAVPSISIIVKVIRDQVEIPIRS